MTKYMSERELKDIIADQAEQIMGLRAMLDYYKSEVNKYEADKRSNS